jgi:hypothetical protein
VIQFLLMSDQEKRPVGRPATGLKIARRSVALYEGNEELLKKVAKVLGKTDNAILNEGIHAVAREHGITPDSS